MLNKLKKKNYSILNNIEFCERFFYSIPQKIINKKYLTNDFLNQNKYIFDYRLKKLADLFLSLILIFVTSPIVLIAAIFIYIEDRGPIFYSQERTGINGRRFKIYKLRSMKVNAEIDGAQWSKSNDPGLQILVILSEELGLTNCRSYYQF